MLLVLPVKEDFVIREGIDIFPGSWPLLSLFDSFDLTLRFLNITFYVQHILHMSKRNNLSKYLANAFSFTKDRTLFVISIIFKFRLK